MDRGRLQQGLYKNGHLFIGSFKDVNVEEVFQMNFYFFKWCCQGQMNIKNVHDCD